MSSLKARKAAASNKSLMDSYNVGKVRKQLKRMSSGPNDNKAGSQFQVLVNNVVRMSGTAKRIAPTVSQLTGVPAMSVIDRLSNGVYHSFPNGVIVSLKGSIKGEGVLDWLTKKVGESGIFSAKTPSGAPTNNSVSNQIKASFPADTKTLYQINNNVYANRQEDVGPWKFVSGNKLLQFYMKGNNVIVAVRGTASFGDLMADIKIAFQNVTGSARYKEDVAAMQAFQRQYPRPQYNYYFTGHSLGGALIDEYLKLGLGTSAISFNPAVQKEFYNSASHHRIYNTQDPLYDLMGRHVPSAEVRDYKGPEQQSTLSKLMSYVPIVGDAGKALKGHSLDNYVGGRMGFMTPAVIDRPYMRGAGPGLYGSGFFENFGKGLVNLAIPALTLGTVKGSDALRGDFKPKWNQALPYVTKTGLNLLAAKTGDPSGIIEQGINQARGEGRAGGRCRWEDKGTRYPDWQEVCD